MRKRVLNSCARPESSPNRRFRAPEPIIQGSGRPGFVGGDAKFIESDPEADAGGFGTGVREVPTTDTDGLDASDNLRSDSDTDGTVESFNPKVSDTAVSSAE
jgi:hypothetical protein